MGRMFGEDRLWNIVGEAKITDLNFAEDFVVFV